MNRTTLIAAACALLVITTGIAVAAPGHAPVSVDENADEQDDRTDADDRSERGVDAADRSETAADDRGGNGTATADDRGGNGSAANGEADERNGGGPNPDLPEQVPEHVSAIHDRIASFLNGDLDGSLGNAIAEVTPGDDAANDEADEDENEADAAEDDGDDESDVAENAAAENAAEDAAVSDAAEGTDADGEDENESNADEE